jgi:hypothetical protein
MKKYYEVGYSYQTEVENDKGESKLKKINEKVLVSAISITDAERIVSNKKDLYLNFKIKRISESNILEVFDVQLSDIME